MRIVLPLLVVAYLLPGLLGHQPWKPDEPYTFGVARDMLLNGDWVVPMVGDLPFVEKPPFYYWVAAIAMRAVHGLAPHDAARLATAFFVLLTLGATAAAARLCWSARASIPAVLLVMASIGLEGHAQRLQVDHALMAGFAVAMLGLSACARERWWGGLALGIGTGMGFLAKGLIAPAVIGLAALSLPALFAAWRTRRYAEQLVYAFVVALPLVIGWPLALWLRDAALFQEWFWDNNVGRFLGFSIAKLGATSEPGFWPATLPWFLFPVWLFAAGAIVHERRRALVRPGVQIGIVMAAAMLLVLLTSASGRAIYAIPLLPPLALVAASHAQADDRRFAIVLGKSALVIAALAATFMWAVWLSLLLTGDVANWTRLAEHFPVPFQMRFDGTIVAAAALLTLGFVAIVALRDRLPHIQLVLWVGMLTLAWGLSMTLWLPWLEAAKGYRDVFTEAGERMPQGCVALLGFGESERAMAEYYIERPVRASAQRGACDTLLWRGKAGRTRHRPETGWRSVWAGSRAGDTGEKFELFVRARLNGFQ